MVMLLVRLDRLVIKACCGLVTLGAAESDELGVAYERKRFTRELPGRDTRDRALKLEEITKKRTSPRRERVEVLRVGSELLEPCRDRLVVLRLIACLTRKSELDGDLVGRWDPGGSALGRLELVLQREDEERRHGQTWAWVSSCTC